MQSGGELAELCLDITSPLCRHTGCSFIPKTLLLFMVKMVHGIPAQGFKVFFQRRASKGFTFESTVPMLTQVQGIIRSCQLVPGNFGQLGKVAVACHQATSFPTAGLRIPKQQYGQQGLCRGKAPSSDRVSCASIRGPTSSCEAGGGGRQQDCSVIKIL